MLSAPTIPTKNSFFAPIKASVSYCQTLGFNHTQAQEQWHAIFAQKPEELVAPFLTIPGSRQEIVSFHRRDPLSPDSMGSIEVQVRGVPHDETPYFRAELSGTKLTTGLYITLGRCYITPQKTGMGLKVFTSLLQLADHNQAQAINLTAVEYGSYTWAKMGFFPTSHGEWNSLKHSLFERSQILELSDEDHEKVAKLLERKSPQTIHEVATLRSATRANLGFQLLCHQAWNGIFSCRPDSKSRKIFAAYQQERTQKS